MRWTGDLCGGGVDERRFRGLSRPPELAAAPRRLHVGARSSTTSNDRGDQVDRVGGSSRSKAFLKVGAAPAIHLEDALRAPHVVPVGFRRRDHEKVPGGPGKQPAYRENRAHEAFLAPLSRWMADETRSRSVAALARRARGSVAARVEPRWRTPRRRRSRVTKTKAVVLTIDRYEGAQRWSIWSGR